MSLAELTQLEAAERGHRHKQVKLLEEVAGGWRAFLEKLHCCLELNTEEESLLWLGDGSKFVVHQPDEMRLEARLGLRVCSLRQALGALGFESSEELNSEFMIYWHGCFLRGNPNKIEHILRQPTLPSSGEKGLAMPNIAYSSALRPLEVRLSPPDAHSQSWEVTIAPSVMPHPIADKGVDVTDSVAAMWHFAETARLKSSVEDMCWEDMLEGTDRWGSDEEMESPLWWSQRSDFSSICTDDLSDMDALSQISAYYA